MVTRMTTSILDARRSPAPALPSPRGELSEALIETLRSEPRPTALPPPHPGDDPLADEDLQLSLYLLYELHYRDYEGVHAGWEWNESLLGARSHLEGIYAEALEDVVPHTFGVDPEAVGEMLFALADADEGPSLSRYLETRGSAEQMREFLIHKSAYQLKEADPHSWVIPRISGDPKAALLEIQYDEYGSGKPERIHARLYAEAMDALGLDSSYGAYLDEIPGFTLATNNLTTLLGLHRSRRGSLVGHLAMFEIGSAIPSRRYGNAIRRLGLAKTPEAVEFFDEHVEADSVHENIAAYDLAQRFAVENPELADDLLFGARALLAVDGRFAERVLAPWERGESSLLSR
jgi:Iron-containing redox enzyme